MLSLLIMSLFLLPQDSVTGKTYEKVEIGVYQGDAIFIKNPYSSMMNDFCIQEVSLNSRKLNLNYKLSALKLGFENTDKFTPVTIKITYKDSLCIPEIVNPNAIFFHSSYKFLSIDLSDSALYWTTEGERELGNYTVEKLQDGIWVEQESIPATGQFEFSEYIFRPFFDVGANKYRVKYNFGNRKYLYSREAEYEHYPDPVTFDPTTTNNKLFLSRSAFYEVFNQKSEMILSGTGTEVDVRKIRPGDYVIYFDKRQPASFRRDNRPPPR